MTSMDTTSQVVIPINSDPLKPPPCSKKCPWTLIQSYLPNNHILDGDGVFLRNGSSTEFISGPCWVTALTRSTQGTDWGYEINWIDQDGNQQSMAFPARKLSEPRAPLAGDLASIGLKIVPGKERRLMAYLGSFNLPPEYRLRSAVQLGWSENETGSPVFVLPHETVGIGDGEKIVFQPEQHSPTIRTMHQHGNIDKWQVNVAGKCEGNPVLVFSLCAAFSGSLLRFAGLDCGGFHFYGTSSKGKTTALQVSASVWGSGGDPSISDDSYIGRWNTTGNALEATAAAHNDGLLLLDEMGTCDARDFGKVIYDLFGGRGKSRLNKNSSLQPQRAWRIMGLSTGEISVQNKIEEDSGRKAKLGQLVRLADIPITNEMILNGHGDTPGVFVNKIKKACSRYYGVAGPQFLSQLVAQEDEASVLRRVIQDRVDQWESKLIGNRSLETHQRRVIRRFATVATAGALAIEFGILKFTKQHIEKSVRSACEAWLGDEGNKPVGIRGIEAIREFILRNPGRFLSASDSNTMVRDLAGYLDRNAGLYLFTKEGFREATGNLHKESILSELDRQGFLFKNESDRKESKHSIGCVPGRTRFYAIAEKILDDGQCKS